MESMESKLIVDVEGGCVHKIYSNNSLLKDIPVIIADSDTDGADLNDVIDTPGGSMFTEVSFIDYNPDYVKNIEELRYDHYLKLSREKEVPDEKIKEEGTAVHGDPPIEGVIKRYLPSDNTKVFTMDILFRDEFCMPLINHIVQINSMGSLPRGDYRVVDNLSVEYKDIGVEVSLEMRKL